VPADGPLNLRNEFLDNRQQTALSGYPLPPTPPLAAQLRSLRVGAKLRTTSGLRILAWGSFFVMTLIKNYCRPSLRFR